MNIQKHEGKKYLKKIHSPLADEKSIHVDIYAVLEAFGVTCPAVAHCIKKLLMPGQRGKGNKFDDLKGALAALNRAVELEQHRFLDANPQLTQSVEPTVTGWTTVEFRDVPDKALFIHEGEVYYNDVAEDGASAEGVGTDGRVISPPYDTRVTILQRKYNQ